MASSETEALLAFAEKVCADVSAMSDDELRKVARKMVAPFMYELASRGCEFTLRCCEFVPEADRH